MFVKVRFYRMMRHGRLSPRDRVGFAYSDRTGPHIDRQATKSSLGRRSIESPRNAGRFCGFGRLFVSVNSFHARRVREQSDYKCRCVAVATQQRTRLVPFALNFSGVEFTSKVDK